MKNHIQHTLLMLTVSLLSAVVVVLAFHQFGITKMSAEDFNQGIEDYIAKMNQDYAAAEAKANAPVVVDFDIARDDYFLGDKDAPVTIVEFSDYQCPYCRVFYTETLIPLKEKFVADGTVKFVYRDFIIQSHADAKPAALAAECAADQKGNEGYYGMHDRIFDGQNLLSETSTVPIPEESLVAYATEIGLDMDEFTDCYESNKFADEIEEDQAEGKENGVGGTPSFFINGTLYRGLYPYDTMVQLIEAELAK